MIKRSSHTIGRALGVLAAAVLFVASSQSVLSQPTANYLRFDGINDYVNAGNSSSVDLTGAFSIELWVFVEAIPSQSARRVISKWGSNSGYELAIYNLGTPTVWFTLNQGQTAAADFSGQLNRWVHVAATWDGTWARLYFDGSLVDTAYFASSLVSSPNNLTFGNIASLVGGAALQGGIDDVRVWGAALDQSTISAWRGAELTGSHPFYDSLAAYWRFNEGSGQTAASAVNSPDADGLLGSSASPDAWDPAWSGETGAAAGEITETISADGTQDFGTSTAVDIDFAGVAGSGPVTVQRFETPPSNVTGVSESNIAETRWVIEGDGLSFSTATEVRFKLSEVPGALFAPASIVVYKRSTSTIGAFTPVTTEYDGTAGEIVASGFTSFSEFIMASDAALPVELVDFRVLAAADRIVLEWSTLSESNNLGFEVQQDIDGRFTTLATVAGALNSSVPRDYRYEVFEMRAGSYTFRLKQIDTNGAFSYSQAIEIDVVGSSFELHDAYPNPFNPRTTIRYTLPVEADVSLMILDLLGRQIRVLASGKHSAGTHEVAFDATGLPSGVYIYRMAADSFTENRSLVLLR